MNQTDPFNFVPDDSAAAAAETPPGSEGFDVASRSEAGSQAESAERYELSRWLKASSWSWWIAGAACASFVWAGGVAALAVGATLSAAGFVGVYAADAWYEAAFGRKNERATLAEAVRRLDIWYRCQGLCVVVAVAIVGACLALGR